MQQDGAACAGGACERHISRHLLSSPQPWALLLAEARQSHRGERRVGLR
eukprot:CAMPEP_0185543798 /NCGR_PEP_ID=MMETSP1381-20130426/3498_1 /TAXON_ID=298111 /ORGANISM="Pavlova sp., Strain CCMP459" /LENGTH=48 /DNA_ID= /DNA_START= /DNA_END= /DNA_ORIENTATION=